MAGNVADAQPAMELWQEGRKPKLEIYGSPCK
jgi:hypothetical protein